MWIGKQQFNQISYKMSKQFTTLFQILTGESFKKQMQL